MVKLICFFVARECIVPSAQVLTAMVFSALLIAHDPDQFSSLSLGVLSQLVSCSVISSAFMLYHSHLGLALVQGSVGDSLMPGDSLVAGDLSSVSVFSSLLALVSRVLLGSSDEIEVVSECGLVSDHFMVTCCVGSIDCVGGSDASPSHEVSHGAAHDYPEGPLDGVMPHGKASVIPDARFERTEEGWLLGHHPDFGEQDMKKLQDTLVSLKSCFAHSLNDLPGYNGILGDYRIPLKPEYEGKPIWTKPRQHSAAELAVQDEKCQEMADAGIIVPWPDTMYASEVVIAAKKDAATGAWTDKRFCVDYRALNKAMQVDHYCLPLPDELFDSIGGASCFSKIDARSAFMQRKIKPEDISKTAFWWRGATWAFTRCPYGLHSAPQQWQQLMDTELSRGGCAGFARAFIDDILVYSSSPEEHIEHVRKVLLCLNTVGIKAHPTKCLFGCDVVEYLGFNVSKYGLTPHEAKVAAIAAIRPASNISEVRSLLGLMNYYRRFVEGFSKLAAPLNALLKKGVPFEWGESQQEALDELKRVLTTEGLALKRVDPSLPLLLYCDWSQQGIGGVLAQIDHDGREHICACISRSLNVHERQYVSYKGELLACVWACRIFRQYLHGRHFTIITDHEPLKWLMAKKDLTGQYARWAMIMSDFEFDVVHRKGSEHNNADILSRMPCSDTTDVSGARLDHDDAHQALTSLCTLLSLSAADIECSCALDPSLFTLSQLAPSARQLHDVVLLNSASAAKYDWHATCFALDSAPGSQCALLGNDSVSICEAGGPFNTCELETTNSLVGQERITSLRLKAAQWYAAAAPELQQARSDETRYKPWRPACIWRKDKEVAPKTDSYGVKVTGGLNTHVIAQSFYSHACTDGVVLLELFGGIAAGLEMVLRNGIKVVRYLYCDIDPVARRVAAHRLHQLSAQYPALFPLESFSNAFTALPQDVWRIDTAALLSAGVDDNRQWLVVAGWECTDLSPAGLGAGLHGPRSSTFFPLKGIIGAMQQLQQQKPPGYFLENTYLDFDFGKVARNMPIDRSLIHHGIGHPITCDAAQFGSYAHRLRHYWTNLCASETLQICINSVHRPAGLFVHDILLPGRSVLPVVVSDKRPFYVCNLQHEARCAFPTFVTVVNSRAFRPGCPGSVIDSALRGYTEPCPDEREVAMGFDQGCTRVPNRIGQPDVSERHRHVLTGRAMDINAVSALFALCLRSSLNCATSSESSLPLIPEPNATNVVCDLASCPAVTPQPTHTCSAAYASLLHCAATSQEQLTAAHKRDIWCDPQLLQYVLRGTLCDNLPKHSVKALQRRASQYRADAKGDIHRLMPDGTLRIVPRPADRAGLVRAVHERTGHFGEKRTVHLLLTQFWWYGLFNDVYRVCRNCQLCRRVNASFNARPVELQPLPIMGLFYRWGADLCGEFLKTAKGNRYIMICVEYFSKHVELIPLPDKKPETTAHAFLSHVLSRFGSCAEVVTDQGTEWRGPFDALLESCFIDHRPTAPNHPQADGLAERIVQTIKRSLRKHCEQSCNVRDWDEGVHWIALGYRCSPQASTGYSPYELLYARRPVVPPAIMQALSHPIDFDSPGVASESLLQRAQLVQRICPEAFGNLLIAQHRDSLRYAMVRSGSFQPTLVKFFPGQFVYVQRPSVANTLQVKARPEILRVVAVNPGGAVTLQGKCGTTVQQNVENLAPCFLPNIDPTIDPTLTHVSGDHPCEVCRFVNRPDKMLLCDNCNTGWHIDCLTPKLTAVPEGVWACPYCVASGVDMVALEARQLANAQAAQQAPANIAPLFSLNRRRMLAEAEAMHKRWVIYPLKGPGQTKVPTWGLVFYLGEQQYPKCLRMQFPGGQQLVVSLRVVRRYVQGVNSSPPPDVSAIVSELAGDRVVATTTIVADGADRIFPHLTPGQVYGADLLPLLEIIDMHTVCTILDPVGSGVYLALPDLRSALWAQHCSQSAAVATYSSTVRLENAPRPWVSGVPDADVTICSLKSPFSLPGFVNMSKTAPCVCIKLHDSNMHDLPEDVQLWLNALLKKSSAHVIVGSVCQYGSAPHSVTWVCFFSNPMVREAMLRAAHSAPTGLTFVSL